MKNFTKKQAEFLNHLVLQDYAKEIYAKKSGNNLQIRVIWEEKQPKKYNNGTVGKYVRANYTIGIRGGFINSSMDMFQVKKDVETFEKIK